MGSAQLVSYDPATNDRLAKSDSTYQLLDGDWWQTTQSWTFPKANDATPVLTSHTRRRLAGLGTEDPAHSILIAESVNIPVEAPDKPTISRTYRDRDKAKVTTITTTGAGLITTQVTESGLVAYIAQSQPSSLHHSNPPRPWRPRR